MSTNKKQTIQTLGECLNAMATYAGGTVPASTEVEYAQWVRWIQLGQEDGAKRGFWARLLYKANLTITANSDEAILPDNFHKVNGIYVLAVNGVDWAEPNNEDNQNLHVFIDPTTAKWKVRFSVTPTANATGVLWYFFNPPTPTAEADFLYLDGEMIMFYALKEYFRKAQQPGSLDDARIEYENRFTENLASEMIPTKQQLLQWEPYHKFTNQQANERGYWGVRSNRRTRS